MLKEDWFEGPMDSIERPKSSMYDRRMSNQEIQDVANLLLGTAIPLMESGQDDYIQHHLPHVRPEHIEAGRQLAKDKIVSLIGGM